MKKIVLLAETGSDIPEEVARQYGIYLVPMHVSFEGETKDDGSFPSEEMDLSYIYFLKNRILRKYLTGFMKKILTVRFCILHILPLQHALIKARRLRRRIEIMLPVLIQSRYRQDSMQLLLQWRSF